MQFRENLVRKREFGDSGPHEQWHHRIVTEALIVSDSDEMPEQPGRRPPSSAPADEPKARGANRSTKVAGKLKVLPEHAEPVLQKDKAAQTPAPPPRDRDEAGEGSGTLADSEEEEADETDEPEDVEVR